MSPAPITYWLHLLEKGNLYAGDPSSPAMQIYTTA